MQNVYLDYNSTTPISPTVAEAMAECYREGFLNPASQHRLGQRARQILETRRTEMLQMLGGVSAGMQTDRLILTSGGTESNNLAISGLAHAVKSSMSGTDVFPRILISAIEHPSVIGIAQYLATLGFPVETIGVDSAGVCDLDDLAEKLESHDQSPIAVVSIMAANNETGVIQPIQAAAAMCRAKGVYFHTDAVQVVGKAAVDFTDLGVDALTFTAHKFHGPRGVGGLLVKHGVDLQPLLYGGFQQSGTRPGTEDVALTTGMCLALSEFHQSPHRAATMKSMRDRLEAGLRAVVPDMVVNGEAGPRMPHTLNVSFPGINRQALLLAADFEGLAISTGSACASGSSDRSHVIVAMGADSDVVEGSVRISLGALTSEQEIDISLTRLEQILNRFST